MIFSIRSLIRNLQVADSHTPYRRDAQPFRCIFPQHDRNVIERMFERLERFAEPLPGTTAWPKHPRRGLHRCHHLRLVMSRNS
jgi:hypothetical protein